MTKRLPTVPPRPSRPSRRAGRPSLRGARGAAVLAALALAAPAAAAGEVSFFSGPPGGVGDVLVLDEAGGGPTAAPAELQGVRLLPLDFVGRTRIAELLPASPRLRKDVAGAARIALPGGAGSLYRFERPGAAGSAFGFFLVAADGTARPLLERAGTGASGTTDPFSERVAIAPDGGAVLVATTPAAGGDLLEVDLASGAAVDRTASLSPLDVAPGGLRLLEGWGAAAAKDALYRFDRAPGAQAAAVPWPASAPAWVGGDLVASADGSTVATTAGDGPQSAHVYALRATGGAVRVTETPSPLSGAGFEPAPSGPWLALSSDGSWCAWRREALAPGGAREAFAGPVPVAAPAPPEHLTADASFVDTLDEPGEFMFFGPASMGIAVGELSDAAGGIDTMDLYRVDLSGAAAVITNLSLTSGDAVPPFTKGELKSENGVWLTPDGTRVIGFRETSGGAGDLVSVDLLSGGTTAILGDVKGTQLTERVGDDVVLALRRKDADDVVLAVLPAGPAPSLKFLASVPDSVVLERPAPSASGHLGLVARDGGLEWVARVHPSSGAASLLVPFGFAYGRALAWTPGGALALTAGTPAATAWPVAWPLAAPLALLALPSGPGQLLPGS